MYIDIEIVVLKRLGYYPYKYIAIQVKSIDNNYSYSHLIHNDTKSQIYIIKISPLVHFFGEWPYTCTCMLSSSWCVNTLEISSLNTLLPLLQ